MTCERTGQVFNYTRKKEVTYRAILAPTGSPDWVFNLSKLSNCIEGSENALIHSFGGRSKWPSL